MLVWPPENCEGMVEALRARGILVRSMAGKPVIDGSFRLTIGTLAQMQRFVTAFAEALGRAASAPAETATR
jgi:histidinol-phosphate aminotransferase